MPFSLQMKGDSNVRHHAGLATPTYGLQFLIPGYELSPKLKVWMKQSIQQSPPPPPPSKKKKKKATTPPTKKIYIIQ